MIGKAPGSTTVRNAPRGRTRKAPSVIADVGTPDSNPQGKKTEDEPLPEYVAATFHAGGPVDVHYSGSDKESVQKVIDSTPTARVVKVKDITKKFVRKPRG